MSNPTINPQSVRNAFDRFKYLVKKRSGYPFISFDKGPAADWENYKPRVRKYALSVLAHDTWNEDVIGSGSILSNTIKAIEIQSGDLVNNLVDWQNRFGHAKRIHYLFLEAQQKPFLRHEIETLLFGLYRGNENEGEIFETFSNLTKKKYRLQAYLFFLKDMDRFMPIHPTGFDRAFHELEIEFKTRSQCSWENYSTFNETLDRLRPLIAEVAGLDSVRLIDAHSFCWMLYSLIDKKSKGKLITSTTSHKGARSLGSREISIIAMRESVVNTLKNANGQTVFL